MTVNDLWHSRISLATRSNTCRKNWKHQQLTATALSMSTSTTSSITAACISEIDSSINSSLKMSCWYERFCLFSLKESKMLLRGDLYCVFILRLVLFFFEYTYSLYSNVWPYNMRLHSFTTSRFSAKITCLDRWNYFVQPFKSLLNHHARCIFYFSMCRNFISQGWK